MSRHTLEDGRWPDPEVDINCFNVWWPWFGPAPYLVSGYYRGKIGWKTFEQSYLGYLQGEDLRSSLEALIQLGLRQNITLLCVEELPKFCHRRLLAEACAQIEPRLRIDIH